MTAREPQVITPPHEIESSSRDSLLFLIVATLLTSMAAAMGWGIRGQYGHETGAMIAGGLASLTLVLLFVPHASSLWAARAAAMMTVAIGIGGSMTYGQTVGLTHDHEILGNWEALRWGMLGLFIKGGLWIGFGGALVGMGLSGQRYRPLELAVLMLVLIGLMFLGIWTINSPFDPENRILPTIYFSDDWYFELDRDLKPRAEIWGGFLLALTGLVAYVRWVRGDRLATRMALVGILAGGLGFSGGQCVQTYHAWNPEVFTEGWLSTFSEYTRYFNWWNMMETSFGAIWGAIMGIGLWFNRHLIHYDETHDEVTVAPTLEVLLIVTHVSLLLTSEFAELPGRLAFLNEYIEYGPIMSTIPLIGIVGGRLWPYLMVPTIVALPICGKNAFFTGYLPEDVSVGMAWLLQIEIPLLVTLGVATYLIGRGFQGQTANRYAAICLLVTSWLFFWLNTVLFDYSWPWREWNGRTPNQLIFGICTVSLTIATVVCFSTRPADKPR